MAAKSNLTNMTLCLAAVCLVCSGLLAFTYALTFDPISEARMAKTNASVARVLPEFQSDPVPGTVELDGVKYDYYRAEGSGYAIMVSSNGFGGPLNLMVGIREDGSVHNTVVLSHSETPGLGAKCQSDERFISQFRGWNTAEKNLMVRKDGGDVDAITASTITSRAYTLAVATAVDVFSKIKTEQGGQVNE